MGLVSFTRRDEWSKTVPYLCLGHLLNLIFSSRHTRSNCGKCHLLTSYRSCRNVMCRAPTVPVSRPVCIQGGRRGHRGSVRNPKTPRLPSEGSCVGVLTIPITDLPHTESTSTQVPSPAGVTEPTRRTGGVYYRTPKKHAGEVYCHVGRESRYCPWDRPHCVLEPRGPTGRVPSKDGSEGMGMTCLHPISGSTPRILETPSEYRGLRIQDKGMAVLPLLLRGPATPTTVTTGGSDRGH